MGIAWIGDVKGIRSILHDRAKHGESMFSFSFCHSVSFGERELSDSSLNIR